MEEVANNFFFLLFICQGLPVQHQPTSPGQQVSNAVGQEHFLGTNQGTPAGWAPQQGAGHSWYFAITEPKNKH